MLFSDMVKRHAHITMEHHFVRWCWCYHRVKPFVIVGEGGQSVQRKYSSKMLDRSQESTLVHGRRKVGYLCSGRLIPKASHPNFTPSKNKMEGKIITIFSYCEALRQQLIQDSWI